MPKTISGPLQVHVAGELTTLATCWLVTRTDGTVFSFTDHDQDLVISSVTYKSSLSYTRSSIRSSAAMASDNLEISGILDSTEITDSDLRAGKFDSAVVNIFTVNWADLTMGILKLRAGTLGKVILGEFGYQTELLGLSDALNYRIGDVYQATCRADLGDGKCLINLLALGVNDTVASVTSNRIFTGTTATNAGPVIKTYTASTISFDNGGSGFGAPVGASINDSAGGFLGHGFAPNDVIQVSGSSNDDGYYVINTIDAFTIRVTAGAILKQGAGNPITIKTVVLGYFDLGYVKWLTGLNAGLKSEVKAWTGPTLKQVTLFMATPYAIQVGDTYTIYPGCDKTITTCAFKFSNVIHFRGEPFCPGENDAAAYANAR